MAWIRAMGEPATPQGVIYRDGSFNVSIDNPGTYTYTGGATSTAASVLSDKVVVGPGASATNWQIIGTSALYDLSAYSVLKVRCKALSGTNSAIVVSSSKTSALDSRYSVDYVTNQAEHIKSIDVSSVTSAYISFAARSGESFEIYEIWAE